MHELITAEMAVMQTAYDAIEPLDDSGRRRAVMWLAGWMLQAMPL